MIKESNFPFFNKILEYLKKINYNDFDVSQKDYIIIFTTT